MAIQPNFLPPTSPKEKPDLLAKVRATIEKHQLIPRGASIVIGISGGPDSLVLLHILRALADEWKLKIHVAHLDHKLRGSDSQADADFVQAIVHEWQLSATIEARDVGLLAQQQRISIEEAARRARYAFLLQVAQQQGASIVAVAHHRDDQVETVLMHFIRGTGLAGLRGMQYKTELQGNGFGFPAIANAPGVQLIRPMLDTTRAEIEEYAKQHYLSPRIDRSNLDTAFFRNRLRYDVLPYLEVINPNLREVIYHSALSIVDDYDLLQSLAKKEFEIIARIEPGAITFDRAAWSALHPALQRGTLRSAIQQLRGTLRDIGWVNIEEARRVVLEKNAGAEATLPAGLMLIVGYGNFVVADAAQGIPMPDVPLLHVDQLPLELEGTVALPNSDWLVETSVVNAIPATTDKWTAYFDLALCHGARCLRRRQPGDRFQPAGLRGHTRTLHDFMIDEKIQRTVRALLPILVIGDHIAWVCGWREDERSRPTSTTQEFWRVAFRKQESA